MNRIMLLLAGLALTAQGARAQLLNWDSGKGAIKIQGGAELGPVGGKPIAAEEKKEQKQSGVVHITDEQFDDEVLKSELPVLVDFWAPWCPPCKRIGPIIDQVAKEYAGKVKVCKLNVDTGGKKADTYNVQGIPTIIAFKAGVEKDRFSGAGGRTDEEMRANLVKFIKDNFGIDDPTKK